MRLMLDTSGLIEIEHDNAAVLDRLNAYKPREVAMSAIALIAAHAASLQLPLAYADGDFNRFPGRKMLWQAEPRTLR